MFFVTIEEIEELNREIGQHLLPRFHERLSDPSTRPADAVPVEMLVISYPMQHPGAAQSGGQPDPADGQPDGLPEEGSQ